MNTELIFNVFSILIPIVTIIVVFRAVRQGSYMAIGTLDEVMSAFVPDIKRGDNVILSARLLTQILKGLTQLFRMAVIIIPLFLVFGPLLFRIVPALKRLWDVVFGAVMERFTELGAWFVVFSPNLVFWIISAIIAHFLIKFARLFFDEIKTGAITLPGFNVQWAETTYQVVRVAIVGLTLGVIYFRTPGRRF